MNAYIQTAAGPAVLSAPGSQITFLSNTFFDRVLRDYVNAFFGKDTNPVVVAYGDPVSYAGDTPFKVQSLIDGRSIRVDDQHPRIEAEPGTIFITAERPRT